MSNTMSLADPAAELARSFVGQVLRPQIRATMKPAGCTTA
jgi:hypothetical protein